jgi:CcmD family protein
MSAGEKYLAAAYLVVLAAVLVYVVIIALKLARLDSELEELTRRARRRHEDRSAEREKARVG